MYTALSSICSVGKAEGREKRKGGRVMRKKKKRMFWNILEVSLDQTPERTDPWRARGDDPFPAL